MADMSNNIRHGAVPQYPKNTVHTAYNRMPVAKITPPANPYRRPTNNVKPRPTVEHIKPLNPQMARARVAAASAKPKSAVHGKQSPILQKKKSKCKTDRSKLHDFFLGFFVGLVIFGIAAIIICSVLIGMLI